MNRKTKIALFGGLIAVPLAVFTISYFNRRIRYSKLSKLIGATPSGTGTLLDRDWETMLF